MKSIEFFSLIVCLVKFISCQLTPLITNWTKSTGAGYKGYTNNVYKVEYSTDYVYVSTNSIPSYDIGPWPTNPNDAKAQSFTFKFPRNPTYNNGAKIAVPLGHIGLWINGVSIYNADDGQTWENKGVWKRNAYLWEGASFDSCKGHADSNNEYHQHISSGCMYSTSPTSHSPLIGFAFDGFPIYGPYGYTDPNDSTSAIKKILPSYIIRIIVNRNTLSNGTILPIALRGPPIANYSLSHFIEDYVYTAGAGDLDEYNGRYCKTPEYPTGTYAYFIATDNSLNPVYPFVVGPYFRGNIIAGNTGTNSGKISVSEATTLYYESTSTTTSTKSFAIQLNTQIHLFINCLLISILY